MCIVKGVDQALLCQCSTQEIRAFDSFYLWPEIIWKQRHAVLTLTVYRSGADLRDLGYSAVHFGAVGSSG